MKFKAIPVNLKIFVVSLLCVGAISFLERFKDSSITESSRIPASFPAVNK